MNQITGTEKSNNNEIKLNFKHRKRGLGIHNWIKGRTAVRPSTWTAVLKVFKLILAGASVLQKPVIGPLVQRLLKFGPEKRAYTKGFLLPLNVDVRKKTKNVVLPIDIMKKAVRETSYRAKMNRCICRDLQDCREYPHDLGCIFIGEGGRVLEERGIGKEVTVEEAYAHIDRAAELGLIGHALWIEVEEYVWGIKDEDMHRFLELCFCCPCCCTAFKIAKYGGEELKHGFQSVGWKSRIDEKKCVDCGLCVEPCPMSAIKSMNGSAVVTTEDCIGCGICAKKCPHGAVTIYQNEVPKEDLREYYDYLRLDLTDGREKNRT